MMRRLKDEWTMPVDTFSKDLLKDIKSVLHAILGRLDQLVGIASKPRDPDASSEDDKKALNIKEYAAIGKAFLITGVKASTTHSKTPREKWYKTVGSYKKLFEIAGITSAIIYAGITYFQWKESGRNFRIDERAWIKIQFVRDGKDAPEIIVPTDGSPLRAQYIASNAGKTYAKNVTVEARLIVLPAASSVPVEVLIPQKPTLDAITWHGGIFPGDKSAAVNVIRSDGQGRPIATAQSDIDGIHSGALYVSVYGLAIYDDVFGHKHWTKFCDWVGAAVPGNEYAAHSCTDANGVDEEDK
jgi:hypothetical protein